MSLFIITILLFDGGSYKGGGKFAALDTIADHKEESLKMKDGRTAKLLNEKLFSPLHPKIMAERRSLEM